MPIICITSSVIKITYHLDNKYMGDIISHSFRKPPDLIWQPYIMAQASSETRLYSLGQVIRVCGLVTRVLGPTLASGEEERKDPGILLL